MTEPASYELITMIKRLAAKLHQSIDAHLRPYDLARSQYVMLYHLHAQTKLSATELAERMTVEPATLSGIVDTLQTKGLVERVEHSDDKRRKNILLTDAGRELLLQIPPPGPEVEAVLFENISPSDVEAFKKLGYTMIDNLEKEQTQRGET